MQYDELDNDKDEKNQVTIYPNPSQSTDEIIVSIHPFTEWVDTEGAEYSIEIYSTTGIQILQKNVNIGENRIMIDTDYKGLLFVRIKNKDKIIYSDKLIRI